MWVAFANAKATHVFSAKNISICAIYNHQSFNDTLTNDIVSFEQLGPLIQSPLRKLWWPLGRLYVPCNKNHHKSTAWDMINFIFIFSYLERCHFFWFCLQYRSNSLFLTDSEVGAWKTGWQFKGWRIHCRKMSCSIILEVSLSVHVYSP